MDLLSRIASWLGENEATISAVVGIMVLGGVLFAGVRSLLRRRAEPAQDQYTNAAPEMASTAKSEPARLDPLTVPGFEGRPAIAVLPFDNLSGDPDQEYFADGIAADEDDPTAHFALGLASANTGQYERAIAAFERVIELNPSSAAGNWGLGSALAYLGRPDEGVTLIEKAIRLSPHDPAMYEFLFDLGVAHFLAARYEEAICCENRSLQARPDQPGAQRVLAASYGHLGRRQEARAALDAMFQLAPDFSVETLRAHVPSEVVDRYLDGWRKAGWEG